MIHLREYDVATEVYAPLVTAGSADFEADPTVLGADFNISLDGGAFASLDTTPTVSPALGVQVKFALSAAEMQCETAVIVCIDNAGAAWEDSMIIIETYGHASARHLFNLNEAMRGTDSAGTAANLATVKAVTDALPNGGALTGISTSTDRLTAARAGVLTDWINDGRLDLLLDAIPTTAMRGTENAATAVNLDLLKTQVGYEDGRIWIDTVGGTAGTTLHVNGMKGKPVLTLADALTLAAAHGPGRRFHVAPGSSITLTANSDNHDFTGRRYVVALGGQSVSAAVFRNAWVTGNDDGTNSVATAYINCLMQANSLGVHQFVKCGIAVGDMVITQAGLCDWVMCRSRVAGTDTPGLDLGAAIGNSSINIRGWHGGLEFKNVGVSGTDNISLEGDGQFVINANCTGGTIAVRGHFKKTDNVVGGFVAGGGVLSEDARFSLTGVNAEVDQALADYGGPTNAQMEARTLVAANYFDSATDGVKLNATQPAGWAANLAASAGQVIKATVDTATNGHTPTTTEFQADDITEATASHFDGRIVIFTSGALAGQAKDITAYELVGVIGQFTVTALTEAPANDDTFVIV